MPNGDAYPLGYAVIARSRNDSRYDISKSTLNLVTAMEGEKPLSGTVRNTLGPDRSPEAPNQDASAENKKANRSAVGSVRETRWALGDQRQYYRKRTF